MRLDWFSPLPPARTDVAQYTARVVGELVRSTEVALWTAQARWDAGLARVAPVRRFRAQRTEVEAGGLAVYHIGNNREFHAGIWSVARRVPGVVVLHDVRLFEFVFQCYRHGAGGLAGFAAVMERFYGEAGRRDAGVFWEHGLSVRYMMEHYPLFPAVIEGARGVVVHTRAGASLVAGALAAPVEYLPLPYPAAPLAETPDERRRRYTDAAVYRLVMFGFLNRNRRLEAVLEALAAHPRRERFRLDVFGELWDRELIAGLVRKLGLEAAVQVHGFVPEERLDAALGQAHLALNLRNPSMGEASGTQLRAWRHALPVAVTRTGWYAELPENTVRWVRPDHERDEMVETLSDLLARPLDYMQVGEAGRALLESDHSPRRYATLIDQFCRKCWERDSRAARAG